jgi:hypothetical protein
MPRSCGSPRGTLLRRARAALGRVAVGTVNELGERSGRDDESSAHGGDLDPSSIRPGVPSGQEKRRVDSQDNRPWCVAGALGSDAR